MKLKLEDLVNNKQSWDKQGINLPLFDHDAVTKNTKENPRWVHFGAGNIFRAFPAAMQQKLLNEGKADFGIIVAEGYDYEIIDQVYDPFDNLGILVTLKVDGTTEKTVIGSVVEALSVDETNTEDMNRLSDIFTAPTLQMVSFTITEKGYSVTDQEGTMVPPVKADVSRDISEASSYIGKLVHLLHKRFESGKHPVALVSMDNCSHNGDRLKNAVLTMANAWKEQGSVSSDFIAYLSDEASVSFPWSMIDKITPRPSEFVQNQLRDLGVEDVDWRVTGKGTYVSTFVNAEEAQYLVVEDKFPNGRPNLDEAGVIFTDRDTVNNVEKMKVCTCLNPLHTSLAIFGCILGFDTIANEMKDADLKRLVEIVGYDEGLKVVVNPGIIEPKAFIDEVLTVRFPNPFMPDTPQRIATDTSQKLAIRFGETIKAYQNDSSLDVNDLELIPLVLAGWVRYLMGLDDNLEPFTLSDDPMLETLKPVVSQLTIGDDSNIEDVLVPLLENETIFGVNLVEAGLSDKVLSAFKLLNSGKGAVRSTLHAYVNGDK